MNIDALVSIRCPRCDKRLADVSPGGRYRTKCPRCGMMVEWPRPHTIRR